MSRLVRIAAASLALSTLAKAEEAGIDRVILKLNGHIAGVGAYIDQSNMQGLDNAAFAVDTGLSGSAIVPLDDGEFGARVSLDLDYASNIDTFLNERGSSDVLSEAWLYWDSSLGRLQAGLMDGAADLLGVKVPSADASMRVDNPEVYLLRFPCAKPFCSSDPGLPGSLFNPNSMQLRSDLRGSREFLKLMYVTPVFDGLRLAVSYTPTGTRDLSRVFNGKDANRQDNIWDITANYIGTVGDIDLALSAGYVTGDLTDKTPFFPQLEGVREWGAGVKLGYREWTLGAAYRDTNVAGGGPVLANFDANTFKGFDTQIWSFGLMYERGPWAASVDYITSNEDLPFSEWQRGSGLQFTGAYTIDEYFRLTAGYQHYEFDDKFPSCGTFFCNAMDANVGYVETTFSF